MKKAPSHFYPYETAKFEKTDGILRKLKTKQIQIENLEIFIRAFKKEEILEIWVKNKSELRFKRYNTYPFCTSSGTLGPKRKEGDFQIPEGVYHINRFNEKSKFYLSLGLNYPNKSDKILGDKESPGSDIFIHGGCWSVGCISITDEFIKEVFVVAKLAQKAGQSQIPVHIFPFKMTNGNMKTHLNQFPEQVLFWEGIKNVFDSFEKEHQLNLIFIDEKGRYIIKK